MVLHCFSSSASIYKVNKGGGFTVSKNHIVKDLIPIHLDIKVLNHQHMKVLPHIHQRYGTHNQNYLVVQVKGQYTS